MECSLLFMGSSVHGIPRQEHWSRLPFPSPGDLPSPGIEPASLVLADRFFTLNHLRSPCLPLPVGFSLTNFPVCRYGIFFSQTIFFSICYNAVLVSLNYFSFCLSVTLLICLLNLKEILVKYSWL